MARTPTNISTDHPRASVAPLAGQAYQARMQRVTISLDDEVAAALDELAQRRGYANRSAAVREFVREAASREAATGAGRTCLGVLSYVFDHEQRDLSRRLTHAHHHHYVLNLSTLHLHLDRNSASRWPCCSGRRARSATWRAASAPSAACGSATSA